MRAMRASQEEVFTSDGEYEFDDEVITSGDEHVDDNVTGDDDSDDSEVFKTDDFKDYSDDSDGDEPLELEERIGNNIIILRGYAKHDGIKNGKVTGKALLINKTPNLSVIDIDINKSLSDDEKDTIRCNILNKLSDDNVIVKTHTHMTPYRKLRLLRAGTSEIINGENENNRRKEVKVTEQEEMR